MGGSYSVPEQFYYAAKEGSAQKLRQLEQRHAPDVAWTNLDGSSAVHMAAASLDAETVRCVVSELGGDAGLRNAKSGSTPIICAVEAAAKKYKRKGVPAKTREAIECILQNGGDARVKNKAGKSAFDLASAAKMTDAMRALEQGTCSKMLDCWCGMLDFNSATRGGLINMLGIKTWDKAWVTVIFYPESRTMLLSVYQTHLNAAPKTVMALTGDNVTPVAVEEQGLGLGLLGKDNCVKIMHKGQEYKLACQDRAEYVTLYNIISAQALLQREARQKAARKVAKQDAQAAAGHRISVRAAAAVHERERERAA